MKKNFFIIALAISMSVFSQGNKASEILKEYGFTTSNVLNILDLSNNKYSFKADVTEHTYSKSNNTDQTNTKKYSFDWKKNRSERYTLLTVNGKAPKKSDVKHFLKAKNPKSSVEKIKLLDENFFVKSEDEKYVVIGFNMPKEKLPSSIAFMAHCTGSIFINKETERVSIIEIKNNEAFNLKIFHITDMDIVLNLLYNEDNKQYIVNSEITKTTVLILGSLTNIDIEEQYSDFKFN